MIEETWGDDERDEDPQDCDLDDDLDQNDTVPCPECGADVYEFGGKCPRCGAWLTRAAARRGPKSWQVVLAVLLLISFLLWML